MPYFAWCGALTHSVCCALAAVATAVFALKVVDFASVMAYSRSVGVTPVVALVKELANSAMEQNMNRWLLFNFTVACRFSVPMTSLWDAVLDAKRVGCAVR